MTRTTMKRMTWLEQPTEATRAEIEKELLTQSKENAGEDLAKDATFVTAVHVVCAPKSADPNAPKLVLSRMLVVKRDNGSKAVANVVCTLDSSVPAKQKKGGAQEAVG